MTPLPWPASMSIETEANAIALERALTWTIGTRSPINSFIASLSSMGRWKWSRKSFANNLTDIQADFDGRSVQLRNKFIEAYLNNLVMR